MVICGLTLTGGDDRKLEGCGKSGMKRANLWSRSNSVAVGKNVSNSNKSHMTMDDYGLQAQPTRHNIVTPNQIAGVAVSSVPREKAKI